MWKMKSYLMSMTCQKQIRNERNLEISRHACTKTNKLSQRQLHKIIAKQSFIVVILSLPHSKELPHKNQIYQFHRLYAWHARMLACELYASVHAAWQYFPMIAKKRWDPGNITPFPNILKRLAWNVCKILAWSPETKRPQNSKGAE